MTKRFSFDKADKGLQLFYFMVAIGTLLVMWLMFEFKDLDSLTAWSINIWDLIFDKEMGLKDFYEYTSWNVYGVVHQYCQGNYLWLIPLSIWNLPLWIITKAFHITLIGNPFCIAWSKLYMIGIHLAMAYVVYRICEKLGKKSVLAPLLVLAAPEILISAGYAGQDEVAYVFSLLLGIYFLMKERRKLSYLFLVISVSFCPIMILPVTAVILYHEKRIGRIILQEAGLLLPLFLFELCYRNDAIYPIVKKSYTIGSVVEQMFPVSIVQTAMGATPLSIVLCIGVLFFCYTRKKQDQREFLYIITAMVMIISFLMDNYFYRTFIYVPFLVIVICGIFPLTNMKAFLFTLLTYCRTFWCLTVGVENNMNTAYIMRNSWVSRICERFGSDRNSLYTCKNFLMYIEQSVPVWIHWMVAAIAVSCALILLYMSNYNKEKDYELTLDYRVSILAYVFCMPIVLLLFWMMLLKVF